LFVRRSDCIEYLTEKDLVQLIGKTKQLKRLEELANENKNRPAQSGDLRAFDV
jgi:hypothetical protein